MSALPRRSSFTAPSTDFASGFRTGLQQLNDYLQILLQNPADGPKSTPGSPAGPESTVRKLIRSRARRSLFFKQELFAEPAWDILLDLYASHLAQQRVSVTSLCLAAGVPTTTALRWIKGLEREGLLVRRDDPLDGRRAYVSLSAAAIDAMERYLRSEQGD